MRLKYYLRGLGIGILVTTIILTIAGHNRNNISDEEIKRRAEKLGMVMKEEQTLFPEKNTEATKAEENTTEARTETKTESSTEKETEITTQTPTEPETEATTEAPTEPETEAPTEPETEASQPQYITATITITRGMYSEAVSQAMQNAGLIDNWVDFNNYLSANGYSESLQTGSYTMNSGMSYQEMAMVLVTR